MFARADARTVSGQVGHLCAIRYRAISETNAPAIGIAIEEKLHNLVGTVRIGALCMRTESPRWKEVANTQNGDGSQRMKKC
jgi:hypothetical protein